MQSEEKKETIERTRFLLKNMARGIAWLVVIVGGYFYAKNHFDFSLQDILGPVYDQPIVIFLIFLASEVIFGLIPPELFMIWALRMDDLQYYAMNVAALSAISYLAGVIGYYIGGHFNTTRLYATLQKNYLGPVEKYFNRFGGFLVIVAALTPVPFAGSCMLMGAVRFPYRRFLYYALIRFVRFGAYAYVVWEANILQ